MGDRTALQDWVTRGLTYLGVAVAVLVPVVLVVAGLEYDEPGAVLIGVFLAAVAAVLLVSSRPPVR